MPEIPPTSTGLSGEYFVAAELLRRGFNVGITMGNAKAIDILAEKGNKQFIIQVKSVYKRQHSGWPVIKEKINPKIFYVFVVLNGNTMAHPDFYILKGKQAIEKAKQYSTRGIITISSINDPKYKDRWDIIK